MAKMIDLSGQRFGKLVVLSLAPTLGCGTRWLCLCDCDTEKVVAGQSLSRGHTISCGCARTQKLAIGQVFGRLTILEQAPYLEGRIMWLCLCVCGQKTTVQGKRLQSGNTKSCGCLKVEGRKPVHGMFSTPEYKAWAAAKQRCTNPKLKCFKDYGGRGITMCERWSSSFEAFFEDMGSRPEGLMLERMDNNGNYEPTNCKWATRTEQNNNQRFNRRNTKINPLQTP